MNVKEVIKISATLLGRENVVQYLENGQASDTQVLAEVDLFTRLCNLVISELSASYIMMKKRESVKLIGGKFYYSNLLENAVKIIGLEDRSGERINYKEYSEYLTASVENAIIEYAYKPANYGLDSEIGYKDSEISARILAIGVCAEECIINGRFEEAIMWHKRYVDGVASFCLPKNTTVKKRSWV